MNGSLPSGFNKAFMPVIKPKVAAFS